MVAFGALVYRDYTDYFKDSTLVDESYIKYWTWLSYYQIGTWGLGWSMWALNTTIGGNGDMIHMIFVKTSQVVSLLPLIAYPVFGGTIWR